MERVAMDVGFIVSSVVSAADVLAAGATAWFAAERLMGLVSGFARKALADLTGAAAGWAGFSPDSLQVFGKAVAHLNAGYSKD